MIEHCQNLEECERILATEVSQVRLLGEVGLSEADWLHLASLVRQVMVRGIGAGTRYLTRKAPACLATFMVWAGITGYREGDYWSELQVAAGKPLDGKWRKRWGQAFETFLQENDLPLFDIKDSHRYVTPILMHGGIPNSCLPEFFDRVLLDAPCSGEGVINEYVCQ